MRKADLEILRQHDIPVYGDVTFRGDCPKEDQEQISAFNWLRLEYPETLGRLALHPRNEQQLRGGQHRGMIKQKAEGLTKGASDIVIPWCPAIVCELKRQDHTKSRFEDGQLDYLIAAKDAGCFVCVALGAKAFVSALKDCGF